MLNNDYGTTLETRGELNREVAKKIMGLREQGPEPEKEDPHTGGVCKRCGGPEPTYVPFNPAGDECDAFIVLAMLQELFVIRRSVLARKFTVRIGPKGKGITACHKDFHVATCLAALYFRTGRKYNYAGE